MFAKALFQLAISLFTFFFAIVIHAQSSDNISASQSQELPSDLVFSASQSESTDDANFNMLVQIDAKTLQPTQFYVDDEAVIIKPLRWSPQAKALAMLKIVNTDSNIMATSEICTLDVFGDVQVCFEDKPTGLLYSINGFLEEEFVVTWSPDGRKAFFVAEHINGNQATRRLIAVDAITGEVLQTLYEVSYDALPYWPPIVSWSPDLAYVAIGVANWDRAANYHAPVLTDLESSQTNEIYLDDYNNTFFICRDFSPQNLLTAFILDEDRSYDQLVIFDTDGTTAHVVDISNYDAQVAACPVWSRDGSSFYLDIGNTNAYTQYILKYSLETASFSEVFASNELYTWGPLVLSPGETHIAFTSYSYADGPGVTVIYPGGEHRNFNGGFPQARYPIWKPNNTMND